MLWQAKYVQYVEKRRFLKIHRGENAQNVVIQWWFRPITVWAAKAIIAITADHILYLMANAQSVELNINNFLEVERNEKNQKRLYGWNI